MPVAPRTLMGSSRRTRAAIIGLRHERLDDFRRSREHRVSRSQRPCLRAPGSRSSTGRHQNRSSTSSASIWASWATSTTSRVASGPSQRHGARRGADLRRSGGVPGARAAADASRPGQKGHGLGCAPAGCDPRRRCRAAPWRTTPAPCTCASGRRRSGGPPPTPGPRWWIGRRQRTRWRTPTTSSGHGCTRCSTSASTTRRSTRSASTRVDSVSTASSASCRRQETRAERTGDADIASPQTFLIGGEKTGNRAVIGSMTDTPALLASSAGTTVTLAASGLELGPPG